MADRNVVNTATLDTLRTTYNSTAADVGEIADITGASGVIGAATDIVEAITLMNTEVTGIKTGATTFASQIVFEGSTDDAYETTLAVTDPTADRTITFPDASGTVVTTSVVSWASAVAPSNTIEEAKVVVPSLIPVTSVFIKVIASMISVAAPITPLAPVTLAISPTSAAVEL